MKQKFLVFFLLFIFTNLFAQESITVMGTVFDGNGEPLTGANIIIKSLYVGSSVDLDGYYKFEIPAGYTEGEEVELLASFVGYKNKSGKITLSEKQIQMNFVLEEDVFQTEAIVVTGIASRTSKGIAEVAVSRVDAADLTKKQNYSGISQLLGGKVAGVQIKHASGNVGGGWRFFIRSGGGLGGKGQPIVYIDGVRVENTELEGNGRGGQGTSTLANLNPSDIESVDILKGPAGAATYGTSGSNGVVLITTKNGSFSTSGEEKLSIDYTYNAGISTKAFKYRPETYWHADLTNGIFTDGDVQEHTINIAGGTSKLRFFTSFQNRDETGLMSDLNWQNRNSFRGKINYLPNEKISLQLVSSYSSSDLSSPTADNSTLSFNRNSLAFEVPWAQHDSLSLMSIVDEQKLSQLLISVNMTWNPIKNLEFQSNVGMDENNLRADQFYPPNFFVSGAGLAGEREYYQRTNRQYTYDFNARYNYSPLNDLKIVSIIGAKLFERKRTYVEIQVEGFDDPNITGIKAGLNVSGKEEGKIHEREAGIFTQHEFSYLNKYFLTLALRRDYASSIGQDAPSITYPKASFALRLDRFNGLLPSVVDLLKLRLAYGETGQLPDPEDAVSLLWESVPGAYGNGGVIDEIGNSEIKPERIKEYEIGLDFDFLKTFSFEFTYYRQFAKNSIFYFLNQPSTGLTASRVPRNVGGIEGWGTESYLRANLFRTQNYNLSLGLIWNYQTNEVTDMGGSAPLISNRNYTMVGYPKKEYFGRVTVGVEYNDDGTYKNAILSEDVVRIGNPVPDKTGSFIVDFQFLKNFNFNAQSEWALNVYGEAGQERTVIGYGGHRRVIELGYQLGIYGLEENVNIDPDLPLLTPNTPEYRAAAEEFAKYDRVSSGTKGGNEYGNYIVPIDWFILRELSLSYNFNDLLKSINYNEWIRDLTIGFSVRNAYRYSLYKDNEFEGTRDGARSNNGNRMQHATMQPRTYNFWLRIGI